MQFITKNDQLFSFWKVQVPENIHLCHSAFQSMDLYIFKPWY